MRNAKCRAPNGFACVQTSPISFVACGNKANRRHLHKFNFLSEDQLITKKDRILIKGLISNKWKYRTKKQGWFYNINWKQWSTPANYAVWPVPYACAHACHPGSGSHGQLFRPCWGSSAWHSCRVNEQDYPAYQRPFAAEASASTPLRASSTVNKW